MKLTEHFTFEEMVVSAAAKRLKLSNTPTAIELDNIKYTAKQMEIVREILGGGIQVLSCFRSEQVNKAVGGSSNSAHRNGLAVDFICPSYGSTRSIAKALVEAQKQGLLAFDQLILEFPDATSTWVHIGVATAKAKRGQVLTAVKQNGKTVYLKGLH